MSNVDYEWSSLPPELIWEIAAHLKIHSDYIRFRAVCSSWRSSTPKNPTHLPTQLPWLMLPQGGRSSDGRRAFFDLSGDKFHFLHVPEASRRRRCCGSSHGWLVILDESPSILIVNPLTRAKINLAPLSSFPYVLRFDFSYIGREYLLSFPDDSHIYPCSLKEMRDSFVKKVVLSGSPSRESDHFLALAIINRTGDLACCKPGQKEWTLIQGARSFNEDAICFNGLFYAVDKYGSLAICDIVSDSPRVLKVIHTKKKRGEGDMQYLVDAFGELLLVTRFLMEAGLGMYCTRRFRVFKLDARGTKWKRVMSLGDVALFLGGNSSLAVMASECHGCKGNRIYFTDDYCEFDYNWFPGNQDVGIYNLEDGTTEQLPCYLCNSHAHLQWRPPIWMTPNPC